MLTEEVLVEAVPAGVVVRCDSQVLHQFIHGRTLPAEGDGLVNR
jgi:hypothetical protein